MADKKGKGADKGAKKAGGGKPKAEKKGSPWKCSLNKGASYNDGKKTYVAGQSYPVSEKEMESLKASGHFHCQPAKAGK